MKRDGNKARDMARLEEARQRTQERLALQQARIDKRFDRMRQRLSKKYGEPTDNQQRIIDAALELLQEDGLTSLTQRKLATKLDMQAPALYWHFKNKEVLIDYMAEAILQSEFKDFQPRSNDESWQDWLVQACQRLRQAMLAHRDGGRIVAGAHLDPAITLMKFFEVSMQSLSSAGVELQKANLIITTAVHFVFGNVIEQQAMPSLEMIETLDSATFFVNYPLMAKSLEITLKNMKTGYDEFEDSLRLIVGYSEK
jgi:TetR/AcrR family tetracycline transcriptional repressor